MPVVALGTLVFASVVWPSAATPPAGASQAVIGTVAAGWKWPLPGPPEVVRRFDPPKAPWGPGHRGVDLASPPGTRVLSAGAGVVSYAGILAGRGVVAIRHPGGLRTTYEPLVIAVRLGQAVAAGDLIGVLATGHLGCPRPACLHWGLLRGDTYLDPLSLLGAGRVRLLPLAGSGPPTARGAAPADARATADSAAAAPPTGDPAGREDRQRTLSVSTAAALGLALAGALALTRRRPP